MVVAQVAVEIYILDSHVSSHGPTYRKMDHRPSLKTLFPHMIQLQALSSYHYEASARSEPRFQVFPFENHYPISALTYHYLLQ
ncbi:hypothetical protein HanXRQr2_Chr13g0618641 [Helianthus annuus]|uniref:Uncharacterized protein n=1 Tax=Helianthus annuus TaxID=4232 RepID=A0A9K3HD72_HELAN|nr:hypothetical protein HanXRQr2_Chr13g0618641 [Helianthus annuus]